MHFYDHGKDFLFSVRGVSSFNIYYDSIRYLEGTARIKEPNLEASVAIGARCLPGIFLFLKGWRHANEQKVRMILS